MTRGLSFLIFVSQVSQKQTQIFDLPYEHKVDVFSIFRSKNHSVAFFFFFFFSGICIFLFQLMIFNTHIILKRLCINLVTKLQCTWATGNIIFFFCVCLFLFLCLFCFALFQYSNSWNYMFGCVILSYLGK